MRIVIIGCGKIGMSILNALSTEDNEIVAIDRNKSTIDRLQQTTDVLAICDDASDYRILETADVRSADAFIASTNVNERNLVLCHMAKKMGAKRTFCEIRALTYSAHEMLQLESDFDIDTVFSPDLLAALEIFKRLDIRKISKDHHFHNVSTMLIGASRVSIHLCRLLSKAGCKIKLLERDYTKCEEVRELLPANVDVVCGDGTEKDVLSEEGIDSVDAFVALTDMDEENLLISVYAGTRKVPHIITKVNHNSFTSLVPHLGLANLVSPKDITAQFIKDELQHSI